MSLGWQSFLTSLFLNKSSLEGVSGFHRDTASITQAGGRSAARQTPFGQPCPKCGRRENSEGSSLGPCVKESGSVLPLSNRFSLPEPNLPPKTTHKWRGNRIQPSQGAASILVKQGLYGMKEKKVVGAPSVQ